jgi:membrane-anchored mycosin MYCP
MSSAHPRLAALALGVALLGVQPPGAFAYDPVLPPVPAANLPKLTPGSVGSGCARPSPVRVDSVPWPQRMLRPDLAWPFTRGAGITVAVLDTGVDAATPALAGRVDPPLDTVTPHTPGGDCIGHGTFLAGLVAGSTVDGGGSAGVAPDARVLPIRVTDADGNTNAAMITAGINAAVGRKAKVILVGAGVAAPDPALHAAVASATAHDILVVAPAAVDAQSRVATVYPAAFAETLSVGGIDGNGAPPSNEPAGAPVDLVAPAVAVVGVGPGGAGNLIGTGPSLAAAFVAGTAALVLAYRPGLTVTQLVERLANTAYHPAGPLPDPQFGYGTVDPAGAVAAVLPADAAPAGQGANEPGPGRSRPALRMPPPPRHPERPVALIAAGSLTAVVLVVAAGFVVLPRGRRRGWRAATGPAFPPIASGSPPAAATTPGSHGADYGRGR